MGAQGRDTAAETTQLRHAARARPTHAHADGREADAAGRARTGACPARPMQPPMQPPLLLLLPLLRRREDREAHQASAAETSKPSCTGGAGGREGGLKGEPR